MCPCHRLASITVTATSPPVAAGYRFSASACGLQTVGVQMKQAIVSDFHHAVIKLSNSLEVARRSARYQRPARAGDALLHRRMQSGWYVFGSAR